MRNNWRIPINKKRKVYSCKMSSEICNQKLSVGTMRQRHEFCNQIIVENVFESWKDFLGNLWIIMYGWRFFVVL